jgi:hemoglobin-like flavoprotein
MALSSDDIRLVRESLPMVRERLLPASTSFYDNLFTVAPELRTLFRPDLAGQGMRFMTTLTMIAEVLDDPATLATELDDLAAAHASLGIRAADFEPMGAALLVTLGETLGAEFTARLRQAWRAAYNHFAEEMIARGNFA